MEESEKRKAIELLKEMRAGGTEEGKSNNQEARLNWMYKGPSDLVDKEEYLLGKMIDKTFESLNSAGSSDIVGRTGEQSNVPKRLLEKTDNTEQVDIAKKILEDPLYAIKQKEMEARKKLLNNPVKLKQIKQMLLERSKQNKAHKQKKKKSKKRIEEELNLLIIKKLKKFSDKEKRKALNKIMQSSSDSSSTESTSSSSREKKHKSSRKRTHSSSNGSESSSETTNSSESEKRKKKVKEKSKKKKNDPNKKKQNKKSRKSSSDSDSSTYERKKKIKTKKLKGKKHSKRVSSSSSSESSESSSESEKVRKPKKHSTSNRERRNSTERSKRKRSTDRDEKKKKKDRRDVSSDEERKAKKNYGLVVPKGSKPTLRTQPVPKYEKNTESKTKYVPPSKAKPLSEKEREEKLREMVEDAKLRKQDRENNLASHRKKQAQEEESKDYDEDFMRRQMKHLTSQGTMADRIKSNINNIQRSKSSMDSSFMRK